MLTSKKEGTMVSFISSKGTFENPAPVIKIMENPACKTIEVYLHENSTKSMSESERIFEGTETEFVDKMIKFFGEGE